MSKARTSRGFTLVEAIMAVVLLGIIGAVMAVFMKAPLDGYFDTLRRAGLTDVADGALRRIARDVRAALPNSLRGPANAGNQCFEFLPVVGGGRYRGDRGGDILDFSQEDDSFDVFAADGLSTDAQVVIYNLGIAGADAWAGDNRAPVDSFTSGNVVLESPGRRFPFDSPSRRFQLVPNAAVVYFIDDGALMRQTRSPIPADRMNACPTTTRANCTPANGCAILAGDGEIAVTGAFDYTPAVDTRNGVLAMTLALTARGESVRLFHTVHVSNVP